MNNALFRMYGESLVIVIVSFVYLASVIRKKRWIKWEQMSPDVKPTMKKYGKKIDLVLKMLVGVSFVFIYVTQIIPLCLDLPYVWNKEYSEAKGEVVSWDFGSENKIRQRAIGIVDSETNKEISFTLYCRGLREGEYVEVIYLPVSKYGTVKE